jgi:large subunit ribosomal protein L24
LRGVLPDGIELRPVSGTIKSDGQSLTLDDVKAGIGGGTATANIDGRPSADGVALNARVEFSGVDGAALHYRGLKMPSGRASMQMTLASQGRSVSALSGALSGSGTMTLESAGIAGLDPRAFDAAIRASDAGQPTDEARLKPIVDPVLSAGRLQVAAAQIPFTIRDGRLRIGATTLDAQGARAIVSGGYDMSADQADIRVSLASTAVGSATSRPEIQIFAAGPPDTLNRTIDVAALSSWLAVRAIDRETRRLDAIERGEPLPPTPASIPPATAALPQPATPDAAALDQPLATLPVPGRDLRRPQARPKAAVPRPPVVHPPVVSQQAAPLPPPIEVRPAPAPPAKPRPRPPLVITPPPN